MTTELYIKRDIDRIHQGDVLVEFPYKTIRPTAGGLEVTEVEEPYLVVLNQDCDLKWDFENRQNASADNQDKFLCDIIVAPAYIAEKVKEGTHLEKLGMKMMNTWSWEKEGPWKNLIVNKNERYHFLKAHTDYHMPNLVIDFKRHYSISREEFIILFKDKYSLSINELYREHLSARFANYISRIGLPDEIKTPVSPPQAVVVAPQ